MRVLVVGHARSATTWVGTALGTTAGAAYVHEPDNQREVPYALRAMAGQGTLPALRADDSGTRPMTRLWDAAFGQQRVRYARGQQRLALMLLRNVSDDDRVRAYAPNGRLLLRLQLAGRLGVPKHVDGTVAHHVVKSVNAPLMLEWILARWNPKVVVCFRHPLDVLASYLDLGLARRSGKGVIERLSLAARAYGTDVYGVPEPTGRNPVPYVAWRVGLVMSALEDTRRAHPEFHVVVHEAACEDPVGHLRALVEAIGLEWSSDTEAFVVRSNRPGSAYTIDRVASELPGLWRSRLADDDVRAATQVLAQFPIWDRYADLRT